MKLVEVLRPNGAIKQRPLFRVMLDLIVSNQEAEAQQLPGVTVNVLEPEKTDLIVGNDLTFAIQEVGQELVTTLRYKKELFDPSAIARMLESFRRILEDALDNPDKSIDQLTLV